jgi:hypothetical protein
MNKLLNPFKYIAGWESLAAGVIVLLITSAIGYFSHIHFPDLISVKTNFGLPFFVLLAQGVSNWLILSILLYFAAMIFSSSKVRAIDIFGTQALARSPYIFAALTGFSGAFNKFGNYLMWTALHTREPVQITTGEIALAISLMLITLLLTIWMVTLMYNAFKVSANLRGAKLILSFIASVIASIVITGIISNYLIKSLVTQP